MSREPVVPMPDRTGHLRRPIPVVVGNFPDFAQFDLAYCTFVQ
jgi:hypothetical protein